MPMVFAGVCSHAPGITGRAERGDPVLRDGLCKDKAKTHVLPSSDLGLMEMTRQRQSESVRDAAYGDCEHCSGRDRPRRRSPPPPPRSPRTRLRDTASGERVEGTVDLPAAERLEEEEERHMQR